jgi:hypothetical protein
MINQDINLILGVSGVDYTAYTLQAINIWVIVIF